MRGTMVKADDSKKMQELTVSLFEDEKKQSVEHWQPFGYTFVPLQPKDKKHAEVLVAFLGGNGSHPVVIATADRRHRPKNLKPGESARFDDQGQITKIARDGYENTSKKLTLTAGREKEEANHELNEQLKGIGARLAQNENQVHALFHVTSRLRELTQIRVPEVAAVANILNKEVSGLEAMMGDLSSGKAQQLLQKTVEQALQKFLSPNLAAIQSVLAAGVESKIQALQGQIENLITSNPIVSTVDGLRAEMSSLASSGASESAVKAGEARITAEIDRHLASNPVLGTVAALRAELAGIVKQAGAGLHFLEPQKRMVQGFTRSAKISQNG